MLETDNGIIDINLSTGSVTRFQVSEKDRRTYLGGKGLGLKLLRERMARGVDPLGEKNILAFIMGALNGFSAVTKSPQTGLMLHSACDGPFAAACKNAGYDGLLISGKALTPVVIVIDSGRVRIEDGSSLWGFDVNESQKRLNPDGKAGVLAIGPAGENQVWIANAASGHHFFGRGGLGAVMGAKKLKGIIARGRAHWIVSADPKRFDKTNQGFLATSSRPDLTDIDSRDVRFLDAQRIATFNHHCHRLGLDSASAAAVMAWCMEAGERGLIGTNLKFGDPIGIDTVLEDIAYRRAFGDDMANGTRSLANRYGGSEFTDQVKGLELPAHDHIKAWGQGLAWAVAGGGRCLSSAAMLALEIEWGVLDPYTTRSKAHWVKFLEDFYSALSSLCGRPPAIIDHLLNSPMVRWTPKWVLKTLMQYFPVVAIRLIDVQRHANLWRLKTGLQLSRRQMLKAGARIHVLERVMNVGEGFSRKDDTLPRRFLVAGRADDEEMVPVLLPSMIDAYYRLRGYDRRGIPSSKTCKRLGIIMDRPLVADPRLAHFKMATPGAYRMKRLYLSLMFWIVGRAIEAACKVDRQVRQLSDFIPYGLTFALNVAPDGPAMVVAKDKKGKVRYLDANINDRYIDLTLTIKNIEAAMLLFTFREAIVTAVARDRLIVHGDIPTACIVVRILERVEVYLLPKFLATLSVRRYPDLSMLRKVVGRGLIYLRALAGI